jgi:hypothetical protein
MAQATTKKPKVKASSKARASTNAKSRSKVKPAASQKTKAAKKPQSRPNRPSSRPASRNGSSSGAASKAKIPLLAGGAALAGTVGGVVIGATRSGGKVLGITLPHPRRVQIRSKDFAKAAKEVGRFGDNVGELTTELRRAREGLGNSTHSSPVEVLLRGLTNRH